MEADFSGYATKTGLKCSDGRTIMHDAFKDSDGMKVPLVWQHGHNEPSNILGHALLEHRSDGTYAYAFFNDTASAKSAKTLVQHGDITALSIYANKLVERGKSVLHGAIREVSLVLSGANPGALIDNVSLAHSDGEVEVLDDEAIIYTGLTLEHENKEDSSASHADSSNDLTVQDVYDSMTEEQKNVCHFMIGAALESADTTAMHSDESLSVAVVPSVEPIVEPNEESVTTKSEDTESDDTQVDDTKVEDTNVVVESEDAKSEDTNEDSLDHQEGTEMTHNVFEQADTPKEKATLTHSQIKEIVADAQKTGSFKESFLAHVATYGIEDIDFLFPDAKSVTSVPDVIGRRQEWVAEVLGSSKHSPFSRIKSTAVDLTAEQARAKGYVKGTLKKDEVIKLLKRVTTPTTIYKKQKLDRDDIVDITDLDVVAWLKAEMRIMLDEELARAILIGDGREIDDEDKIDEEHLRPIAYDNEMYAHQVTVQGDIAGSAIVEAVLRARSFYKGTGTPNFYTTDTVLTNLILLKDTVGRRLYETEASLAAALRVNKVITVEVMDNASDVIGVIVNMADYTLGADKGGNIAMFDDFDIDYNQYKYLIETRVSGALTKPKSAVVLKQPIGTLVTPLSPSYDGLTHTITFPGTTGVVYSINGVTKTGTQVITETTEVNSAPDTGYSFPHIVNTDWTFVYTA